MSIRGLRAEEKIMFGKKPILVAGAMSGTSLDGVDGAEIVTDGESIFEFGAAVICHIPRRNSPFYGLSAN